MFGFAKYRVLIAVLLSLFIVTAGCRRDVSLRLEQAEALADENPEKALEMLDSIDSTSALGSSDKALWGLLKIRSEAAAGMVIGSDSLIPKVLGYYSGNRDPRRFMMSLYYAAVAGYDSGEFPSASVYALKARKMASGLNDAYWEAKTDAVLGDIYSSAYVWKESASFYREAAELYRRAGKNRHMDFSLCDYACALGNQGDLDTSLDVLDEVILRATRGQVDSLLAGYALRDAFPIALNQGNPSRARKYLHLFDAYNVFPEDAGLDLPDLARLEMLEGNYSEAARILGDAAASMVSPQDSIKVIDARIMLYETTGEIGLLSRELKKALVFQNAEISRTMEQSVAIAQRNYLSSESELNEEKASRLRSFIYLICFFSVIIIGLLCVLFFYWRKLKRKELKEWSARVETLVLELENWRGNRCYMFLKEKCELLGNIYNEFIVSESEDQINRGVKGKLDDILKDVTSEETMRVLERNLDIENAGVISALRSQVEGLSESDVRVFIYGLMDLSPRAASALMNITVKNFYNRRLRLRKRIESSGVPDAIRFLAVLK